MYPYSIVIVTRFHFFFFLHSKYNCFDNFFRFLYVPVPMRGIVQDEQCVNQILGRNFYEDGINPTWTCYEVFRSSVKKN